jgi:hypothetical protein
MSDKNKHAFAEEVGASIASGLFFTGLKYLTVLYFSIVAVGYISKGCAKTDDSDLDKYNRSGVTIHTDHLTGVQYLRRGNALCVRVDAQGDPVLAERGSK